MMMTQGKRLTLPILPRREEEASVQEAWEQMHEGVQVVFIGGASGTGKSTFAQAITSDTQQQRRGPRFQCVQAFTKFDQKRSCTPLSSLRHLVSELVVAATHTCGRELEEKLSRQQLKVLQSFMMTRYRYDRRATRNLNLSAEKETNEDVGESGTCFGTNAKTNDSEETAADPVVSKDGRILLTTTLKAVLRAITSVTCVILTLDDLHWSCKTSREVLEDIVMDPKLRNILVCATCRNEEPTATSGFYEWKDKLDMTIMIAPVANTSTGTASQPQTQTINLDNLELPAVQELLSEACSLEVGQVEDLAAAVFRFTHGNLFFLKVFLERLQDDGLLTFDMNQYRWVWNTQTILQRESVTDNVVQILAARIDKLSQPVQDVLLLASCFGAQFDVRALEVAKSALGVDSAIQRIAEAREHELVVPICTETSNVDDGTYFFKFAHDAIQSAVEGLSAKTTQDMTQLRWDIGLLMMQDEELLEYDCNMFATVDHLNVKGVDDAFLGSVMAATNRDDDDEEGLHRQLANLNLRIQLANLNYRAGCKAASLSAFGPAAKYIQAGIASLGDKPFDCSYELAYKLFAMAAKTECVGGNLDASQAAAQEVLDNAKSYEEKMPLLMVMFNCYQARSNPPKLLEFALDALRQLGERIEEKPSRMRVHWECKKMTFQLKRLSDEQILELPTMTDYKKETVLQLIYKLVFPLYTMEKQGLCALITCRMVDITLKYGLSKLLAPHVFVLAATYVIGQSQDIEEGYRLGKLAEKIIAKQGLDPSNTTVICYLAHLNKWWREPVPNCLDSFIECNGISMKAGQVGNAFQSTVGYGVNYFYSGLPLGPLLNDLELFGNMYLEYNQTMFFLLATPLWQCVLNLMGKSADPTSMEHGVVMERRKVFPNHRKCGAQSVQSFQMMISYYMGDLATATEMADKLVDCKPGIMGASFWYSSRRFFLGLIAIANYRSSRKRKDKAEAEKQLTHFKKVVKKGAINLLHKLQLLKAEMMTTDVNMKRPKDVDAIVAVYNEAIVSASRAGFLQDAALANYLLFQFCIKHKVRMHLAEMYLKNSIENWIAWGATAVADSIVTRHEDIFGSTFLDQSSIGEMKDASMNFSGSLRSRPRFDPTLSLQHKQLRV